MTHTTSLEISKELKEAGWKKPTMFWWRLWINVPPDLGSKNEFAPVAPAPISDEILEEFPNKDNVTIKKCSIGYMVFSDKVVGFNDKTPTNAIAQLWLHYKKEGLLNGK